MKPYLISLAAVVAFAAAPGEPNAWSESSWGMSVADLKATFRGQVVDMEPSPETRFKLSTGEETARVGIPSIDIIGEKFTVLFLTEPAGLHEVYLRPLDRQHISVTLFHSLQAALSVKYGNPFSRSGEISIAQWKTKTSLIQLKYSNLKNVGLQFLDLTYQPLPVAQPL